MSTVIEVKNLGKKYLLKHQAKQESYVALRDVITDTCKNIGRKLYSPFSRFSPSPFTLHHSPDVEEFWALKDVSFEVKRGDRIGIIGRNGAGKSTLLKILSRITEPTTGSVRIKGRVASLLEVGTGFHPELTGRENIFLNGAILGMGRVEIKKKFDEIVAFAEVEKFLDTPVKRYSSGMYVRLAFAVAAHLEPEILVIDEVLAVGDTLFQKKCLGKMEDVSKEGRTLLFVSHNMATISSLCQKAMLLDGGQLVKQGPASNVILEYYSQGMASPAAFDNTISGKLVGDDYAKLLAGSVVNSDGNVCTEVDITQPLKIIMKYQTLNTESCACWPNFHFFSSEGSCIFVSAPKEMVRHSPGVHEATCHIPGNLLNEGTHFIGLALITYPGSKCRFFEQQPLSFHVRDPIENVPTRGGTDYAGPVAGVIRPLLEWQIRSLE
jgi:lipopolysaccharide transport system ATP-binding protein